MHYVIEGGRRTARGGGVVGQADREGEASTASEKANRHTQTDRHPASCCRRRRAREEAATAAAAFMEQQQHLTGKFHTDILI